MTNEQNEIEKLNLNSMNIADEKQNKLLQIFPEIRTEGGKIDFEKLKLTLGEMVDVGKERYGMNWPGKAECFKTIQTPSLGTLLPQKEESIDFETSENLVIEGDNLEVLKILQKSYLGKIKMIYIDPPYNTGKDFIYPDNFNESLQTYLEYTGQVDSEGKKFGTNTETDGRFHSKWMNMMWPRLYLARNLLDESGVIFVSIDENEVHNLRKLIEEIFGEENYAGEIVWKNSSKNDQNYVSIQHEYILVATKNRQVNLGEWKEKKEGLDEIYKAFDGFKRQHGTNWKAIHQEALKWFKQFPESNPISSSKHYSWMDENGVYFPSDISGPNYGQYRYDVLHPVTKKVCKEPASGWRFPKETMLKRIEQNLVHFGDDETTIPNNKTYLKDTELQNLTSIKYKDGRVASNQLKQLMEGDFFTNPKDTEILANLISAVGVSDNDYILDFFAGSGSVAQAVLDLNVKDEKNRKFILVQLPEATEHENFPTISSITRERVRRVIKKHQDSRSQGTLLSKVKLDIGFRAFRLSESNFKTWNQESSSKENLEKQLELHVDHVKHDRTDDDILYEILLKSGFSLTSQVETQKFGKQTIYSIASGMLLVCLEDNLTIELITHIADQKPERVVCLDQGFANNDQLKSNSIMIMNKLKEKNKDFKFLTI